MPVAAACLAGWSATGVYAQTGMPAVVDLAELDGNDGFVVNGVAAEDVSGRSVSGIGDVNGDGFDDMIITSDAATIYVVFGGADIGAGGAVELSALDGTNGFVVNGAPQSFPWGHAVSGAGDINADGVDDFIVGASEASPNGRGSGASYVVFGRVALGAGGALELSALDGNDGFVLNGVAQNDRSGRSVSGAGDIDGDGVDDVLIGAYGTDGNGDSSGASYVVFGRAGVGAGGAVELADLDGTDGFVVRGSAARDRAGFSVSGAGDVNGDGIDDFVIGAPGAEPNGRESGTTFVVFGGADVGAGGAVELSDLDSGNGDGNGDGDGGAAGIVAGALASSALDSIDGFVVDGAARSLTGWPVSGAGDVNGDGLDDVLIGAFGDGSSGSEPGASYVVFGGPNVGADSAVELSTLDGSDGFALTGTEASSPIGNSFSGVGDINGDGVDDFIVGAAYADTNGPQSGASYVVFGGEDVGAGGAVDLSALDGSDGFTLVGAAQDNFSGWSVSGAGDVNGDGVDDVIISALGAEPNGFFSGASYVVFGLSDSTPPVIVPNLAPAVPDGANGWYTSDVSLSWDLSDAESDFSIDSGCVNQGVTTDTDGLLLECTASSAGGTASESVTVKRDATAPQVTILAPASGATYVLNEVVAANWSAFDATVPGSGLDSASGTGASGEALDTSIVGEQLFNVTATDRAGNQTSVDHVYMVLGAAAAIDVLVDDVEALDLPRGLERRLVSTLERAARLGGVQAAGEQLSLESAANDTRQSSRGSSDDIRTARARWLVYRFIWQVNVQRGRRIDAVDAAALTRSAFLVLGALAR